MYQIWHNQCFICFFDKIQNIFTRQTFHFIHVFCKYLHTTVNYVSQILTDYLKYATLNYIKLRLKLDEVGTITVPT